MRAPKYCAEPGCYALVRTTRCDEHRSGWNRAPRSASSKRTGTRQWKLIRAKTLTRDGHQCQLRGPNCTIEATQVDHVIPVSQGGGDELSNTTSVCKPCHDQKSAREAAAGRGQ